MDLFRALHDALLAGVLTERAMGPARLVLLGILLMTVLLLAGCTTFGVITWHNTLIVLRQPDQVPARITVPRRADARLAALWIGHATVLVQMDDKFILTDPVLTRYVGGISARLVEPGLAAADLPWLDAVLVSHRHFDHLSTGTLTLIGARVATVLTAPGAAADLPPGPYGATELPAWSSWQHDGLRVTAVPVLHEGGRLLGDQQSHARAYTGFIVEYHGLVVFFAGDTAYDPAIFQAIAARYPKVDLALLPIGPIRPPADMLPHHMNPSQALDACAILRAVHMVPIHFGTFINSFDRAGEVEQAYRAARLTRAAATCHADLLRIGEQRVVLPDESVLSGGPVRPAGDPKKARPIFFTR